MSRTATSILVCLVATVSTSNAAQTATPKTHRLEATPIGPART